MGCFGIGSIEVAFSEVERDFLERAPFPLFRFGQPEHFMLGIPQGALPAHEFLAANLDKLVHELHSCDVKPINPCTLADSAEDRFNLPCRFVPISAYIAVQQNAASEP